MLSKTIKSQEGYVTVYVDGVDVDGSFGVDIALFVRGKGFQCVLDNAAALELSRAIQEALGGGKC